jgi:hypothetical protein
MSGNDEPGAPFMQSHRMSGNDEPGAPFMQPHRMSGNDEPGAPFMQSHRMSGNDEPGAPFMQSHRMSGNDEPGAPFMQSHRMSGNDTAITLIVGDGLSALAAERHALPVIDALLPLLGLNTAESDAAPAIVWALTPIVVAEQARVALGDAVGAALDADVTVMLLGERPGLSSPDSLGAYITWAPRPGRTDAERNCVSNIRPPDAGQAGLDYTAAAARIAWYVTEGRRLGLTGVALRAGDALPPPASAE